MRHAVLFLLACACLLWGAAAVARVEVEGVRGALRNNVLAHLELDDASCEVPFWRLRRLRRKAEGQIRAALEAYGYYNPVIDIGAPATSGCWLVRVVIERGPPVRLGKVDVRLSGEAAGDRDWQRLLAANPLQQGAVLRHATYERYKRSFQDLARRQGYFAGTFRRARIEVYTARNLADIVLDWDSGPRYRFGAVNFDQSVLRPELLARYVGFQTGAPYDGTLIEELYDALLATGYFAGVDLRTRPGTLPDTTVPVDIVLTPAARRVYTTGVGYGTDVGPKFRTGYTDRRVNDRGHQFEASLNLSQVLSQFGASYRFPRRDPRVEWLSIDAGYQDKNTDTSESKIWRLGVQELHRRRRGWIETRFIDFSVERFTVADRTRREFLPIPGISWSHRVPPAGALVRPERGHNVRLRVSGSAEWLGSEAQFLQVDLFGKRIMPLWEGGRLLMRGEIGATARDKFVHLPVSVRYFAGGDSSVRGYAYEALGPSDDSGNIIGGSHKLVGSLEIDQRVHPDWSVAAFVDAGNASDDFSQLRLKTSAGVGLRWYSPLGPIRIDFAVPFDKDASDNWRLHVTLGPDL